MSDNQETIEPKQIKTLPIPKPEKSEKKPEKQFKKNSIDFYIEEKLPKKPEKKQQYTKLEDGTVVRLNKKGEPDKRCGPNGTTVNNLKKSVEAKVKEALQTVKKQEYDDDDESDSSESEEEEYEITPKKKLSSPRAEPEPIPEIPSSPQAVHLLATPVQATPKVDYDEYLRLKKEKEQLEEVKRQNEILKKQFNFNEHLNKLSRLSHNVKIKF